MSKARSVARLQVLALLSQQLPHHESDAIMRRAVSEPDWFAGWVLRAHDEGRVHLPRHLQRVLEHDLKTPLASAS